MCLGVVGPLPADLSFQVDLRFLTMLTAIATQGAISRETQRGYYVKSYKLEVSTNGEDWMVYRHGKNHKVGRLPQEWASKEFQPWLSEAQRTHGSKGYTVPEIFLFYVKVIGKLHFSSSLAAVAFCTAEREKRGL